MTKYIYLDCSLQRSFKSEYKKIERSLIALFLEIELIIVVRYTKEVTPIL